ncbi:polysaccharide biosynthesis tyrosine autokinase [Dyella marensis]|jgi:tyrosine-protein kinase Etk/Wzc|uniref:Tyrosine-protein kinase Etk/Wzc n=1 Tax=Dyella marensis TaxID=500610 RepID=A0A1I2K5D1_9GAMM|nr:MULTISPECIES: polysaccharide biosynthesis tyrosine autokinase [Dyella]SFF61558.1 tyrosine-protein kinase Etk/Wzc [Dyella marensis]
MTDPRAVTQRNDEELDLGAILGTLVDNKWLIFAITGLFLACSLAYALLATPIYQADAMVQVEQKVPELPGISALSQTLGASNSQANTEIALITSRAVIGKAVDDLKLDINVSARHFPMIGTGIARRFANANPGVLAAPWLGFNRYDWGGSKLDLQRIEVPDDLLGKVMTLVAGENGGYTLLNPEGDELLQGAVGQIATGHGVTLQVGSLKANPGTRFDVRRERALTTINQLQQAIQATEKGKDSGIIGLSYQNASPKLAVALLDRVSEWYVRQNVEWNAAEAANSLKFVQEQLPKVRQDLDRAQAALNAFQIQAKSVDITMQTKALLDQSVAVEANIQQLRMQQADVARRFTPQHPAYRALMQQIGQLEQQKGDMEKQVGALPDTQQELLKLTRDVDVSNQTYTGLLNQAQQLDIARAGKVGNVHIVDNAQVDVTSPVKPKKAMVVFGGTFVGAFLAFGLVFVRQMLNRGVEEPSVIEQLGLPVYASVPVSPTEHEIALSDRARSDGRHHLLAISSPADLATEALRSLRTSLHFARMEAKNNILMISGSSPEAGKTFVSANLAAVMAQAGQRVLVIDGDMRKGTLHKVMGGRPNNGLSELISGQIDMETAIRPIASLENLHYIARGKIPPNPSELLMNQRFAEVMDQLMPRYDLVLIDTPPILAVTDASIIGHMAGTCLLVVRFGLNQAREIALARQRFAQNGVEIKGAIFNAVERRSSGYYSYGYYEYKNGT